MNAFVLVRKNLFRRKLRACLMIASILVVFWGYQGAFIAISALVLFCGIAFTIATRGEDYAAEPAPGDD